ncbi:hypothetical protein EXN66_Car012133 [Channa argus]|uniref:Uncharacterized protein n=1 Tax=Channa argus TaxID=215402 RepID=A0A6G1Q1Q3_CHAAH|nr:hypothetical protein EXN66_Car012133 [Channa argus]
MAPVFGFAVAPSLLSRTFVTVLWSFVAVLALAANNCVSAAIKYDRHTLFHIKELKEDYVTWTRYKPFFPPVFERSLTSPQYLLLSKGRGTRKKPGFRAGVQTRFTRYRASTFTPSGTGPEQVERCLRQVSVSVSGHGAVVATSPLYDPHYSRTFPTRQAQTAGSREQVLLPVSLCGGRNGAEPLAHTVQSAGPVPGCSAERLLHRE